jgi:sirohydrochlorin ferrochelatase
MSDGWMVSSRIPDRIRAATARPFEVLAPLGRWPATWDLCARRALQAARPDDRPWETTVLLAAHGSPSDPRPAAAARAAARRIASLGSFRSVHCGFVEEEPGIAELAGSIPGPALCLPFFALKAGHVLRDLPQALTEAGFQGPLLEPIGQDPSIARLVAGILQKGSRRAA